MISKSPARSVGRAPTSGDFLRYGIEAQSEASVGVGLPLPAHREEPPWTAAKTHRRGGECQEHQEDCDEFNFELLSDPPSCGKLLIGAAGANSRRLETIRAS